MRLILTALTWLRRRSIAEDGVVMIYALIASVVVMSASAAAVGAVLGGFPLGSNESFQKEAYAAAQAGIQRYMFDLNNDSEYWTQCVPAGSNWIFNTNQTLVPQPVPGSSTETYAVKLLPAIGQSVYNQCSTLNPVASMVQATGAGAGTIRISSTGKAGNVQRTIVAALREQSFLDYAWFTQYETSDPSLQVDGAYQGSGDTTIEPPDQCTLNGNPSGCGSNYDLALAGAQAQCSQFRYAGRYTNDKANYGNGNFFSYKDAQGRTQSFQCDQIEFVGGDSINGPFHSNDSVLVCGGATFGRDKSDSIEFGGPSPGYVEGCGGASPNIQGTYEQSSTIEPPPNNGALANVATSAYSYTGTTCLTLGLTGITVGQPNAQYPSCFSSGLPTTTVPYPTNGVLYVNNSTTNACSLVYDVDDPSYTGNTGCGTVYVSGVDAQPLTIGAANDIVIDGSITYSGTSAILGLIANNFVRIYHPVDNQPLGKDNGVCTQNSTNAAGSLNNLTIDAMIFSLNHSFIVDQYDCGKPLGTLTINGGIAQKYRGPVGTGGGSPSTGYLKDYTYDDRLRYEEPPHFLNPVEGAWRIQRQTECDVTSSCDATTQP